MMSNSTTYYEDHQILGNKFTFRVFSGKGSDSNDPILFEICNMSSLCFYIVQAMYSSFLLYRLCRKTETKPKRSCSLITATSFILYSAVALACLFGNPKLAVIAQEKTEREAGDVDYGIYLILLRDLPFTLSYIAHQIIISQYYELALTLEVLVNLGKNWMDAGNKLSAKFHCLNATMTIVGGLIVAHFLDVCFYTIKESSTGANVIAGVVAVIMRGFLTIMALISAIKIHKTVGQEPFLNLDYKIFYWHVVTIGMYFIFQLLYELCGILLVTNNEDSLNHT